MMRVGRDFESSTGPGSGARLFDDAPYRPSAPTSAEKASAEKAKAETAKPEIAKPVAPPVAPPPAAQPPVVRAAVAKAIVRPAPIAAAPIADYEAAPDWSLPRPSRTGIAPSPVIAPVESLLMWQSEAHAENETSSSTGKLGARIAIFASALRDRIAALFAR